MLDDDKWCVNQLITPKVFIERYRNYKLDLMDKTHIDETAQQVLKIAENAIKNVENAVKNAFKGNAGCVRGACVDFKTVIDHVDVTDIVYPGYTFWYDEYGNIGARCKTLIVVDIFTTTDASIDDVCRDAVKVILAGYDCVEVTSKMYLNVTLDATVKHINQYIANELAKLLSTIKSQIEDTVNYVETRYHISIKYAVDIA